MKEDAENVSHIVKLTSRSVIQSVRAFTEGSDEGRQQTRLRGTGRKTIANKSSNF